MEGDAHLEPQTHQLEVISDKARYLSVSWQTLYPPSSESAGTDEHCAALQWQNAKLKSIGLICSLLASRLISNRMQMVVDRPEVQI